LNIFQNGIQVFTNDNIRIAAAKNGVGSACGLLGMDGTGLE
jgi:hypothetical protein